MRLFALTFALVVGVCSGVLAQAGNPPPAQGGATAVDARELFRRGEAAYSAGNYEVAIREWNAAYQADPRPRIQFNLSQAYERLGQLEAAMDALRKFLDSADPDDPMYSDANARLAALNQRLALTGVMVKGGDEGGQIKVDEKDWGRTPRPDKINVTPGGHELVIRWPNGREFRTNVMVPAGQVIEVNVPTETGGPVAPAPAVAGGTAGAHVDTGAGGHGLKPLGWYLIGGAVAAAGVGLLVYGIVRNGDAIDCGGTTYCENPSDADSAKTQSLVGMIGGGVLIAGGAALITLGALKSKREKQSAQTSCGIGWASASCRVRF